MRGVQRVKLIYLYENKGRDIRFFRCIYAPALEVFFYFGFIPAGEVMFCPLDKMLGCFSGRKRHDSVGIFYHPFNKAERRQFAERGKVGNFYYLKFFGRGVNAFLLLFLEGYLFYFRAVIVTAHDLPFFY